MQRDTPVIKTRVLRREEDKTSRPLNRRGIADLPLLRALLVICQKLHKLSFWEVMNSFVLVAYVSLAASRALLQQLLASLKFNCRLRRFILLVETKEMISSNYGSSTSC